MDEVSLSFSKDALNRIVDKAFERKTGARGLRSILEEIMLDVMFELPNHKGKSILIDCKKNKFLTEIKQ